MFLNVANTVTGRLKDYVSTEMNKFLLILFILIGLFQIVLYTPVSAQALSCEEIKKQAAEARENGNLDRERNILANAVKQACKNDSWVHSQLSLCYLEVADRTYSGIKNKKDVSREVYFEKALETARIAEKLDPANYYAYEQKAMAFGGLVEVNGLKQKARIADSIRVNAEIALELLPDNDRAMHILGRWHYEVASLSKFLLFMAPILFGSSPDASMEQAREYFRDASQINDLVVHNYWLGLANLELYNKEAARSAFQHVIDLPIKHHNDPLFKEYATEKLEALEH